MPGYTTGITLNLKESCATWNSIQISEMLWQYKQEFMLPHNMMKHK